MDKCINKLSSIKQNNKFYSVLFLVLAVYLASRIIISLEFYAISKILDDKVQINLQYVIRNLWRWDSGVYASIAQTGYMSFFDIKHVNWPFFPLWVIILKICSLNGLLPIPIVGEIINQLLFVGSLVMFYLLLETYDYFEDKIFAVFILAISPANIYFCSGLTESLFLFLSLSAFYFLHQNKPKYYLLCGALLSATRMTGSFFIFPMLYHLYKTKQLTLKKFVAYSLISVSGLLMFMLYMKIHTGSALAFLEVESKVPDWVRPGLTWNFHVFHQMYTVMTTTSHMYDRRIFLISLFLISFILWKKGFVKEAIFNICCVLPGVLSGNMWNSFRFDTAIFTFYLGCLLLAKYNEVSKYLVLSILVVLSFICWYYWLSGSWWFA